MSAHDVLRQVIDRESEKLLKRSKLGEDPMAEDDLARLEILSRCAKALRLGEDKGKGDDDGAGGDTAELLRQAEGRG